MNRLPQSVSVERINNGTGIAKTLQSNRAVYHSACVDKFDDRQVSREPEKQSETIDDNNALIVDAVLLEESIVTSSLPVYSVIKVMTVIDCTSLKLTLVV
ncbi:hypothetical protein QYM36_014007 [Artemia franciscana]|uniref:Uncharacterized protein n=1 Tax=Artemia franciscana TaxID=6661 RepID=A0AA88HDB1_ARTSF|nr:hypothetical protein QYM36_014007 [Artemia franciscana]